jgi:GTP cyclohydrolase FolE2
MMLEELPEEARFRQLSTQSKQLLDTVKTIAYHAETAMATSLREHLKRPDEARWLLRAPTPPRPICYPTSRRAA